MTKKTQAIVLNKLPYTDNKKIVTIFTKNFGKKKLLITFSKSKKNKNNYFEIFQILNIEFSPKKKSEFISLKESSLNTPLNALYTNLDKLSIVFFLAGILNKIIYNDLIDQELFEFIKMSIILLDKCEHPANFHPAFLVSLTKHLGIEPMKNYSSNEKYFDVRKGKFVSFFDKDYTFSKNASNFFYKFINAGMNEFVDIPMNKHTRNELIDWILKYYLYHFPNIDISGYQILKDIYK